MEYRCVLLLLYSLFLYCLLLRLRRGSSLAVKMMILFACNLQVSNKTISLLLGLQGGDDTVTDKDRNLGDDGEMSHIHEVNGVTQNVRDMKPTQTILCGDELIIVDADIELQGRKATEIHVSVLVGEDNVGRDKSCGVDLANVVVIAVKKIDVQGRKKEEKGKG